MSTSHHCLPCSWLLSLQKGPQLGEWALKERARQGGRVESTHTVVPWYPWGIGSRTPVDTEIQWCSHPLYKGCSTGGPLHPRVLHLWIQPSDLNWWSLQKQHEQSTTVFPTHHIQQSIQSVSNLQNLYVPYRWLETCVFTSPPGDPERHPRLKTSAPALPYGPQRGRYFSWLFDFINSPKTSNHLTDPRARIWMTQCLSHNIWVNKAFVSEFELPRYQFLNSIRITHTHPHTTKAIWRGNPMGKGKSILSWESSKECPVVPPTWNQLSAPILYRWENQNGEYGWFSAINYSRDDNKNDIYFVLVDTGTPSNEPHRLFNPHNNLSHFTDKETED